MIKRYHEAPLSIFDRVQQLTDGDYALVHLFEENAEYLNKFKVAVANGRDVILDNSIFELGTAFDGDRFASWVDCLKPTWYIVPDSWKNCEVTISMFDNFISKYPNLPGQRIGVAQGHTVDEVTRCYQAIEPHCGMVAFNLDFSSIFYDTLPSCMNQLQKEELVPYCVAMSLGRIAVLTKLWQLGVINISKPHHLLGCGVPQEVMWYPRTWTWVRSIDTCNPVIAGMEHWAYDRYCGINKKSEKKLFKLVDTKVADPEWQTIKYNIETMRGWC